MTTGAADYEEIVAELARRLATDAPGLPGAQISHGGSNRIVGKSGYPHQIDVSIRAGDRILLIECKQWKHAVDPEAVLAFSGRVADIREANTNIEVTGRLVTTVGLSKGASALAEHHDIGIDTVRSPSEYALRVWNMVGVGLTDRIVFGDSFSAVVVRADEPVE